LKLESTEFFLIFFDGLSVGPYLRNTLLVDKVNNKEEALLKFTSTSPWRAANSWRLQLIFPAIVL
jgi:hypothetical protein